MHVVWHGHYITYFEEGRRAFGRKYGLDYPVFLEHQVVAPLVKVNVEYLSPAREGDVVLVTARLLESQGAKIEFEYDIRRESDGRALARGYTMQAFTTLQGELVLTRPAFMAERYKRWETLWIAPTP